MFAPSRLSVKGRAWSGSRCRRDAGFASMEEDNVLSEEEQWAKRRLAVEIADKSRSLSSGAHSRDPLARNDGSDNTPGHFSARKTSPSSDEFDHGTCLFLVVATTSARTRVSICCTSSPGVPIWRDSAAENGLLAPSPSSAT